MARSRPISAAGGTGRAPRQGMEDVGAVDDQPLDAFEDAPVVRHGRSSRPRSPDRTRRTDAASAPGRAFARLSRRSGSILAMLLLVDLDGVVYRGAEPVPGVAAVLAARAAKGDDVVYVTNNSMWYRADYVTRLSGMGAPCRPDRIVSSARATALYLPRPRAAGPQALVVGGNGLVHELEDVGIEVVFSGDAAERWKENGRDGVAAVGPVDAVVVGLDLDFTYARLACAAEAVRAGARFIATNRDPVYPLEKGLMPGAGSIVAAIVTATGVTPVSLGKPGPLLLEVAAHAVGRAGGCGDDRRQPRHGRSRRHRRGRPVGPDDDRHHDSGPAATLAVPTADRRRRRRRRTGGRPRRPRRQDAVGSKPAFRTVPGLRLVAEAPPRRR